MALYSPGKSGNPNGRPLGAISIKRKVMENFYNVLNQPITLPNGKQSTPHAEGLRHFLDDLMQGKRYAVEFALKMDANNGENFYDVLDSVLNSIKKSDLDFISYRIYHNAFDIQQKVLESKNNRIIMMAGRRSGKTELNKRKICSVLIHDNTKVLYLGKTITIAIEQIFNGVSELLKELSQEVVESRRNEGYLKLSNGSEFYIRGNNSTEEKEKLRGFQWDLVIIDECQSQTALAYLLESIIEPELIDRQGQLILAGTGPRIRGTFWETLWTGEKWDGSTKKEVWPKALRLNWNISDNPFIRDYQKVLESIRVEKGWSETTATYLCEYLGKIAYDDDALCFRLKADNFYTEDELAKWVASQPISDLRWAGGLDYGFVDADGFVIVCYSISRPEKFVISEYKANRSGLTQLSDAIKMGMTSMNKPYFSRVDRLPQVMGTPGQREPTVQTAKEGKEGFTIYADTGGAGSKISFELADQYHLPIMQAYKSNKGQAIELLQEEVKLGRLKVKHGGHLEDECMKTVFARDEGTGNLTREIDDNAFHPDVLDALLYALRPYWLFEAQKLGS